MGEGGWERVYRVVKMKTEYETSEEEGKRCDGLVEIESESQFRKGREEWYQFVEIVTESELYERGREMVGRGVECLP